MSSKHESNYQEQLTDNTMNRPFSDHKDRMREEPKSTFNWEAGRELAAQIRPILERNEREQTHHSQVEGLEESFKKAIGYTKVGSQPVLPTENSDVIVGALMVALTTYGAKEFERGVRLACELYDIGSSTKVNIEQVLTHRQT